eukprot:gene5706-4069_t
MGAVPSREAPNALYSLRYGNHELGLIPFTKTFITPESVALRQQLIRLRNDPGVRYNQMRPEGVPLDEMPPATYTEADLNVALDAVERSLFPTNEAMLAAFERERGSGALSSRSDATEAEKLEALLRLKKSTRPVPCVIIFVYMKGREDLECFHFQGRRVNVIGFLSCRVAETDADDQLPYLELHKAMLKAAGDRTIERVLTLAATLFHEQMARILADHRPQLPFPSAILDRLQQLPLRVECMWNNFPILKLLFDTLALLNATAEVKVAECPPEIRLVDGERSKRGKMVEMVISGKLLSRIWTFMVVHLLRPTNRGTWMQFSLANESQKSKRLADWFIASAAAQSFFHDAQMTQLVRDHLNELHQEIVAARSAPQSDENLWSGMQERSHDNKLYRIYHSPVCGPFLTTVKQPSSKESGSYSNGLLERGSDAFSSGPYTRSVGSAEYAGVPSRHLSDAAAGTGGLPYSGGRQGRLPQPQPQPQPQPIMVGPHRGLRHINPQGLPQGLQTQTSPLMQQTYQNDGAVYTVAVTGTAAFTQSPVQQHAPGVGATSPPGYAAFAPAPPGPAASLLVQAQAPPGGLHAHAYTMQAPQGLTGAGDLGKIPSNAIPMTAFPTLSLHTPPAAPLVQQQQPQQQQPQPQQQQQQPQQQQQQQQPQPYYIVVPNDVSAPVPLPPPQVTPHSSAVQFAMPFGNQQFSMNPPQVSQQQGPQVVQSRELAGQQILCRLQPTQGVWAGGMTPDGKETATFANNCVYLHPYGSVLCPEEEPRGTSQASMWNQPLSSVPLSYKIHRMRVYRLIHLHLFHLDDELLQTDAASGLPELGTFVPPAYSIRSLICSLHP